MRSDLVGKVGTLRRLTLLFLLYLIPISNGLRPIVDPDVWWHLRTGQWIIEHGAVPRADVFSTFGTGKPWIAYSWLFEVIVYHFADPNPGRVEDRVSNRCGNESDRRFSGAAGGLVRAVDEHALDSR